VYALQDEHDVALFEHYGTSEIVVLDLKTNTTTRIGPPRLYIECVGWMDGLYQARKAKHICCCCDAAVTRVSTAWMWSCQARGVSHLHVVLEAWCCMTWHCTRFGAILSNKSATHTTLRCRFPCSVDVSPDGRFIMATWLEGPYSFNVPCGRFPQRTQLWRRDGSLVRGGAWCVHRVSRNILNNLGQGGCLSMKRDEWIMSEWSMHA
jgi:hypothetical protein